MRWDDVADNLLINPDFLLAQESTSFAALADDTYILDGFVYHKSGAMVHTGSQSTDVPTVAQSNHKSTKSLLLDCTTVDSTIATGDFCYVAQFIEGLRALDLFECEFTIRFWHKHTKTGTHCVAIKNSGSDRTIVYEYTQAVTDTWELATIHVAASPSAGTWDYSTGIGLQIIWTLAAGATYQATGEAWQTGDYLATSSQVNNCDSTANNFRIAQVAVYPGGFDLAFVSPPFLRQVEDCRRYFEKSYLLTTDVGTATQENSETSLTVNSVLAYEPTVSFLVEKRATPTVKIYNTNDGSIDEFSRYDLGGFLANAAGTTLVVYAKSFQVNFSGNASSNDIAKNHWTADARLRLA